MRPYLCSLNSPTPLMRDIASSDTGRLAAISQSVASEKMTKGGICSFFARSMRTDRSTSKRGRQASSSIDSATDFFYRAGRAAGSVSAAMAISCIARFRPFNTSRPSAVRERTGYCPSDCCTNPSSRLCRIISRISLAA